MLVVQVKTLRWSYEHAVGVQLADAGRLDLAREAFARANDAQRRYATRINLGTLTNYLQGDDPPDAEGPLTAFRDAVDMRPSASLPRVRLADSYIRGTEGEGDTPDERTQRTIEMLNRAIDIDPNHVEAALMRADLYLSARCRERRRDPARDGPEAAPAGRARAPRVGSRPRDRPLP